MKLSEIVIKIIGIVLAIVGFCLLLSVAGISLFGIGTSSDILSIVLGLIVLGGGIVIVRGGNITI